MNIATLELDDGPCVRLALHPRAMLVQVPPVQQRVWVNLGNEKAIGLSQSSLSVTVCHCLNVRFSDSLTLTARCGLTLAR